MLQSGRDYEGLERVWKSQRASAGKPFKDLFSAYVQLQNEAALLNGLYFQGSPRSP